MYTLHDRAEADQRSLVAEEAGENSHPEPGTLSTETGADDAGVGQAESRGEQAVARAGGGGMNGKRTRKSGESGNSEGAVLRLARMSKLNVLLYAGSGVSAASRDHALASLRAFLATSYDVQLVSPKSLREEPWTDSCALLVMPGGRDLPYQYDLAGRANERIRDWVKSGGKYLGFCAGAYYAARRVEFELGTALEVVGERELDFFPGVCRGTTFPGFAYDSEAGAREVVLELDRTVWRNYWSQSPDRVAVWYNGGGSFVMDRPLPNVQVLARYDDLPDKPIAGVSCTVGKGLAVLWAVHPEHPTLLDRSSADDYATKETSRQSLLRSTLSMLNLDVSEVPAPPPRLLPLFLTSDNPDTLASTLSSLACIKTGAQTTSFEIKDRHDRFVLHNFDQAATIWAEATLAPGTSDAEELQLAPKNIIACIEGLPARNLTPLFDVAAYFRQLRTTIHPPTPFGDILLYGEIVTSTQTMLDKCVFSLGRD